MGGAVGSVAALGAVVGAGEGARRILKRGLVRAERQRSIRAALLIAPLVLFLLLCFFAPIGSLLVRGFTDGEVRHAWPRTAAALDAWDGAQLPGSHVVSAFIEELPASRSNGALMAAANRLNQALPGARTLLTNTASEVSVAPGEGSIEQLTAIDARWGERETWAALRQAAGGYTPFYLLASLDLRIDADDTLARQAPERRVFLQVFARTFWISAVVAVLCALLGYPLAYLLAALPDRLAHPLLVLVLLPFWTSVLVRTAAWMVLLQDGGLINSALLDLGFIAEPLRLIYGRAGVYIAMTHVLLPYFVLPLYAVMKRVPAVTLRAALSLGATPWQAYWRVYFPQTLPGAAAGALMVFILALGYYITPALVGGPGDQMISYFIAYYTQQSLNWGMAAALSLLLLATTLVLLAIAGRLGARRELVLR